ncbi:HAAS signaling domain-containing protein [Marinicrinis sediminis]|uniref:DUF1700 domain-containing protein n=1 Tax=Marinicrinis sediminis TaxID=1652465 RepID=A0ABW5RAF9_9BACL
MNKHAYLQALRKHLNSVQNLDTEDIIQDYALHFDHAVQEGRAEEEVARRLGEPQQIAAEIMAELQIDRAEQKPTMRNLSRAVMATASLGVFNLLVVLLPFLLSLVAIGLLYGISLLLLGSPLVYLIQDGFSTEFVLSSFNMLGFMGIGVLLLLGMNRLTRGYYRFGLRYLRWNIKKTGVGKHE